MSKKHADIAQELQLMVRLNIRRYDLSDIDWCMVAGDRQAGLGILKTAVLPRF